MIHKNLRNTSKNGSVGPKDSSPSPQNAWLVLSVGQCIFFYHSCDLSRILIKLDVTAKQNVLVINGSEVGIL